MFPKYYSSKNYCKMFFTTKRAARFAPDARLKFWTQNSCCHFLPVDMLLNSKLARRAPVTSWPGSRSSSEEFSPEFEIELVSEILSSQFSCVTLFPRFFSLSYAGLRFTPLCRPLTTDWTRKSHFFRPVWPSFSPRLSPTRTCNGGKWNVSLGELIYCPFSLHF